MFRPLPEGDRPQEPATRVHVDGEVFEVRASGDRPGQYHFDWVTGPNPGYGFSTGTSDGHALTEAEIEESARNFLAQVDPESGYIE